MLSVLLPSPAAPRPWTVSHTEHVGVAPGGVRLRVYTVVWVGLTSLVPVGGTAPTPGCKSAAVAPGAFQLSVTLPPLATLGGLPVREQPPSTITAHSMDSPVAFTTTRR